MRHIGQRIRAIRESRGITQKQLGKSAGVSGPFVSMVESGRSDIDSERIELFARALGVSPAEFFDEEQPKPDASTEPVVHFSLRGHLTQKDKQKINALVQELTKASRTDREMVYRIMGGIFGRT